MVDRRIGLLLFQKSYAVYWLELIWGKRRAATRFESASCRETGAKRQLEGNY